MQSALLLYVVVGESAAVLQLLHREDEALPLGGDALLGTDGVNGVEGLDFKSDGLACRGPAARCQVARQVSLNKWSFTIKNIRNFSACSNQLSTICHIGQRLNTPTPSSCDIIEGSSVVLTKTLHNAGHEKNATAQQLCIHTLPPHDAPCIVSVELAQKL